MMNYGWQSEPSLWAQIPDDLRDSQLWRFVGFTEIESVSIPEGEPGIYLFCTSPVRKRFPAHLLKHDLFSNLLTPIYIGRTKNLRKRFVQHCKNPSSRLADARDCFGNSMLFWFHSRQENQIQKDEAIMIRCFGPTANERIETVKAIIGAPVPIGVHYQNKKGGN